MFVVFLGLLAGAVVYGMRASDTLTEGGFEARNGESERAAAILARTLRVAPPDVIVVYSHSEATFGEPAFTEPLRAVLSALAQRPEVLGLTSPFTPQGAASPYAAPGRTLVSRDGHAAIVMVHLSGSEDEKRENLERITPILRAPGLTTWIGGRVATERQTQRAARHDLMRGDWVALPIIAVLLVFFFRGIVAALLPLLVAGFAVAASLSGLRFFSGFTEISLFAINIVTFLGLGIAVDYSLFMTSRFREELATHGVAEAVERTLATAGRTIAFSGATVAGSMLALYAFPNVLLHSVALSGVLVVTTALIASLVFLPALFSLLGPRIEWLRIGRTSPARVREHWRHIADFVMSVPVPVVVLTTALLLLLGFPFLRLHESVGGPGILPTNAEGRRVAHLIASDRFEASELSPIVIAVETREDVLTRAGLEALEAYANRVAALPGVVRVDAIVGGSSERSVSQVQAAYAVAPAQLAAIAQGHRTAVRVIATGLPGSDAQMNLVDRIRHVSVPGIDEALVSGQSAGRLDLRSIIIDRLPIALSAVAIVAFVLLFVAFGSVIMPIKALVMNVLSLTAGFGMLVLIFQDGRLEDILRFQSPGTVDLMVPVAMFPVLFGLAMDYELFLLSRIKEEYDRVHDTRESVSFGIQQSGTVITRAALVLIAALLGFVTADMLLIKELGLGTAVAIAVDVTIVRALLVPATMRLLGDYNWWAPKPLAELWRRLRIGIRGPSTR